VVEPAITTTSFEVCAATATALAAVNGVIGL
jgi:hypothetical protein